MSYFLTDPKYTLYIAEEDDKPGHQQTPPKDPISSTNVDVSPPLMNRKLSSTRASQFIVDDAADKPVISVVSEFRF